MVATAARGANERRCRHTWQRASKNTAWRLPASVIGDFGTLASVRLTGIPRPTLASMTLAIVNGVDRVLTGGAVFICRVMPVTPLPCNDRRLEEVGRACH